MERVLHSMLSTAPRFAVIIPVYNAEKYLEQTLASVQAQTRQEWELIAVDDGSTDRSPEIVTQWAGADPRIRLVRQANGGVASARNRGYQETHPDAAYIIFLDNDDLWEPDTLQVLGNALDADATACAAYGQIRYIDADGKPHAPEYIAQHHAGLNDGLTHPCQVVGGHVVPQTGDTRTTFAVFAVQNCIVSPGVVLLRRTALPPPPLFDAQAAPCDDWELWARLTRQADFVYVRHVVLNYRLHGANASRNNAVMDRAWSYASQKIAFSPENSPEQAELAGIAYAYLQRQRAASRLQWARECVARRQYVEAIKQFRHYVRYRVGIRS